VSIRIGDGGMPSKKIEDEIDLIIPEMAEASAKARKDMLAEGRKNLYNDPDTKHKNLHIQQVIKDECNEDRHLTINDVADILGVSQQTVRNWEEKGKLIPERTEGNHRRYKESDVNAIRKQSMAAQQILINGTTPLQMEGLFHSLFGAFDPMEKINVTFVNDTIKGKLRFAVESEDGLTQTARSFEV